MCTPDRFHSGHGRAVDSLECGFEFDLVYTVPSSGYMFNVYTVLSFYCFTALRRGISVSAATAPIIFIQIASERKHLKSKRRYHAGRSFIRHILNYTGYNH